MALLPQRLVLPDGVAESPEKTNPALLDRRRLLAAGVARPFAELAVAFDANTRAGKVDLCTDAVAALTGEPPTPLRDAFAALKRAVAA